MSERQRTLALEADLWEQYRLYQRDILMGCVQDADLLVKRLKSDDPAADRRLLVNLLWDKRCQPWKFYRDEQRAIAVTR